MIVIAVCCRRACSGYIAVELAGVFNGLGTDTSLFVRKHCALREFDTMISSFLDTSMKKAGEQSFHLNFQCTYFSCSIICFLLPLLTSSIGIHVHPGSIMKEVVKEADGTLTLHLENGEVLSRCTHCELTI